MAKMKIKLHPNYDSFSSDDFADFNNLGDSFSFWVSFVLKFEVYFIKYN